MKKKSSETCSLTAPGWDYEQSWYNQDLHCVAGVDEAGRGPLAGEVVAAALWFKDPSHIPGGLNDSKKLSEKRREELFEILTGCDDIAYGIGMASVVEIDRINILKATHLAMARAVEALPAQVDVCLIDGLPVPGFAWRQQAIVKGDAKSLSISAASILAKVTRDRLMVDYDRLYPQYGFARHKGYGTKAHLEALRLFGPCPIHRRSFAPVSQLDLPL